MRRIFHGIAVGGCLQLAAAALGPASDDASTHGSLRRRRAATHARAEEPSEEPSFPRRASAWNPIPRFGDQPLLVILCEFADEPGRFTGTEWASRFFDAGGFAEYFRAESGGSLRYTGSVVGLADGVGEPVANSAGVNYVRLPEALSFYAGSSHGFSVSACQRTSHAGVAIDALGLLDAAGFDFAPYTDPSRSIVENVIFLVASRSFYFVGDRSQSFLSTAYELKYVFRGGCGANTNSDGYFVSSKGIKVNAYTFCTARTSSDRELAVLGVCAHEHGHALGLQDWYGVGQYSLMGQGLWGPDSSGDYPAHMSAFDKQVLGWLSPTDLPPIKTEVELVLQASHLGGDALRLTLCGTTEYYLVENRQELAHGSPWAQGLAPRFCPGVLIWHIDTAIADFGTRFWRDNTVNAWSASWGPGNNPPPHNGITVKEADGDDSLTPREGFVDHECDDTHRISTGVFEGADAELHDGTPSGVRIRITSAPDLQGNVRVGLVCPRCTGAADAGAKACSTGTTDGSSSTTSISTASSSTTRPTTTDTAWTVSTTSASTTSAGTRSSSAISASTTSASVAFSSTTGSSRTGDSTTVASAAGSSTYGASTTAAGIAGFSTTGDSTTVTNNVGSSTTRASTTAASDAGSGTEGATTSAIPASSSTTGASTSAVSVVGSSTTGGSTTTALIIFESEDPYLGFEVETSAAAAPVRSTLSIVGSFVLAHAL